MPIHISFLQGGIGIEFYSTGIVTGPEIINANTKIYTPKNLLRLKYKIIDRTTCTDYRVTNEDVEMMARQDNAASKINSNITVVYVSATPLQYGVTRMWQAYANETGWESEIFKDRDSANRFIEKKYKIET